MNIRPWEAWTRDDAIFILASLWKGGEQFRNMSMGSFTACYPHCKKILLSFNTMLCIEYFDGLISDNLCFRHYQIYRNWESSISEIVCWEQKVERPLLMLSKIHTLNLRFGSYFSWYLQIAWRINHEMPGDITITSVIADASCHHGCHTFYLEVKIITKTSKDYQKSTVLITSTFIYMWYKKKATVKY